MNKLWNITTANRIVDVIANVVFSLFNFILFFGLSEIWFCYKRFSQHIKTWQQPAWCISLSGRVIFPPRKVTSKLKSKDREQVCVWFACFVVNMQHHRENFRLTLFVWLPAWFFTESTRNLWNGDSICMCVCVCVCHALSCKLWKFQQTCWFNFIFGVQITPKWVQEPCWFESGSTLLINNI